MKIEAPKIVVVKNVLWQTLILVIVYIVINLMVYGFNTFRLEINLLVMVDSMCVMALVFFIFKFRKSILSIELNESSIVIVTVNNSRKTFSWKKLNGISIKHISAGNKYIRLPGYLFNDSKQKEEYLNFIDKTFYEQSTSCLKCGDVIPEGSNVCKSCGWSYQK